MERDIYSFLEEKDVKITRQRREIISVLAKCSEKHLTADEIYRIIKRTKDETIGLATVYRNLELFTDLGLVSKVSLVGDSARYELSFIPQIAHHHLICLGCGKVQEVDSSVTKEMKEKIKDIKGFRVVDKPMRIYGYCKECNQIVSKGE